jgi:hypothetical protein
MHRSVVRKMLECTCGVCRSSMFYSVNLLLLQLNVSPFSLSNC